MMNPNDSIQELVDGNMRFYGGKANHPNQAEARRYELLAGQHPFAVILTCSDSRVPPEIIFDRGIGDLFVIRTAGNVVDDVAIGSIEYAVEHLHTSLVVVLGHQGCGAVSAAVKGGDVGGHIASIIHRIQPAVAAAKGLVGDTLTNTVDLNVWNVVNKLKASQPILGGLVKNGTIKIIGARYDMDSGKVNLLPER